MPDSAERNAKPEESGNHHHPHYKCTNKDCRAIDTVLEPDEVFTDETSGQKTCTYCGQAVSEVTGS